MPQQIQRTFHLHPIGRIHRGDSAIVLEIDTPFRAALRDLDQFSHVMVFWWAEEFDTEEYRRQLFIKPPYAPDRSTGVFATRSPFRPNPIAMTTCPIVEVKEDVGEVTISDIDAYDGTWIVDLKAYLPICDRVQNVRVPEWLAGWPDWLPTTGMPLEDPKD